MSDPLMDAINAKVALEAERMEPAIEARRDEMDGRGEVYSLRVPLPSEIRSHILDHFGIAYGLDTQAHYYALLNDTLAELRRTGAQYPRAIARLKARIAIIEKRLEKYC